MKAVGPPHLFTLRLWAEDLGDGQQEWRVQLKSVAGGEPCYFRDWPTLIHLLLAMLPGDGEHPPGTARRQADALPAPETSEL